MDTGNCNILEYFLTNKNFWESLKDKIQMLEIVVLLRVSPVLAMLTPQTWYLDYLGMFVVRMGFEAWPQCVIWDLIQFVLLNP